MSMGFSVECLQRTSLDVGWLFWNEYRRARHKARRRAQNSKPMPVVDIGRLDG